jgi:hypothetical protein
MLAHALYSAARRSGAIVETDKKITGGGNKQNLGTDHQRIAKLDRENEVAPPPKIAPSVGKVRRCMISTERSADPRDLRP